MEIDYSARMPINRTQVIDLRTIFKHFTKLLAQNECEWNE